MSVERMLSTLLYEGYALYPYTPGAIKIGERARRADRGSTFMREIPEVKVRDRRV